MARQCVKEDPPGRGDTVSVFVSPSHHKTSRLSTSGGLLSTMTSLRIRTRKASLVSFCSRQICQDTFHDACFCLTRHDLFKTQSVQDTFHDACSCHTPHVNFSSDRVRGARFCHHLHSLLQWSNTWFLHLLSPTRRLLQWSSTWRPHLLSSMPHQRQWLSAVL